MRIAVISGSHRIGRKSHSVAEWVVNEFRQVEGVEHVEMLDVKEYDFPVMEERLIYLNELPEGLQRFSDEIIQADALVIVTPEYNGGIAGSLKNTLDYFRKEFNRKPMGAVTVSSGNFGGVNALHQLWFWMSYVGGIVSPVKFLVSNVNDVFDEEGKVVDERFARNGRKFVDELIWLTSRIKE